MFYINIFVVLSFVFVVFCYLIKDNPKIKKIADFLT